jgi:hypothetical protein
MTSGLVRNNRNGLRLVLVRGYAGSLPRSSRYRTGGTPGASADHLSRVLDYRDGLRWVMPERSASPLKAVGGCIADTG